MRSLGLLSVAHAVNHSFAVLLPPIFLAIIDEFGVTVRRWCSSPPQGRPASGLVQLSYAELTCHVLRRLGSSGPAACCSVAGLRRWPWRRAS